MASLTHVHWAFLSLIWMLLSFSLSACAGGQQCAAETSECAPASSTGQHAKYWLANRKSTHLAHVKDAFARLGYKVGETADDDWVLMWSFHSPFHQRDGEPDNPAILKRLLPHQMQSNPAFWTHPALEHAQLAQIPELLQVNQIPGASEFASKVKLAKASPVLSFLPRSFPLPEKKEDMAEYMQHFPETEWLVKGSQHRGVRMLGNSSETLSTGLEADIKAGAFVQQLIRPYLIDGKLWDVGLYVAVTSVNPLRVYVYDNLLLRHCAVNYTRDLVNAPLDSYVVAESYSPPWTLDAFRPHYSRGMSTANVLRAYMHENGVDFEPILNEMKQAVVRLLLYYEPMLRASALSYPYGSRSFFGMYRFDFMLDGSMQPWLIEVNQSPNLSSSSTKDLRNMFQRISFSLLHLMGFGYGQLRHPLNAEDHIDIIAHHNDLDIGWRFCSQCTDTCKGDCAICRRCRTPEQTRMLRELLSEHRNQQGFIRLFPLDKRLAQHPKLANLAMPTENDELMRLWIQEKCHTDQSWC